MIQLSITRAIQLCIVVFMLFTLLACHSSIKHDQATVQPTSTHVLPTAPTSPAVTSAPTRMGTLAVDSDEGMDTDGIDLSSDSLIPPIPPSRVEVFHQQECVTLAWNGTGSDTITEYQVFSRTKNATEWNLISNVPIASNNLGRFELCLDTISIEIVCTEFAIRSLNIYDNFSKLSEIVTYGECGNPSDNP